MDSDEAADLERTEMREQELRDALREANSLCRSAYSIACRDGRSTNWHAFRLKLERTLKSQQEILNGKVDNYET